MKRFFVSVLFLMAVPICLFAKDYKKINYQTENVGPVLFDHDIHVQKLANDCTVCHNSLYKIAAKNPVISMAEMEKGKSCGKCHNKSKAFGVAECLRCHTVDHVPIVIPDFGTLDFPHKPHLKKYTCIDCHDKLFLAKSGKNKHVSMKQMEEGKSCGACHEGKIAFTVKENCTKCHAVKDITYATADPFSHNYHLKMFGCYDCHSKLFIAGPKAKRSTMLEMEYGNSCGGCHDSKTAFSVKGDCNRCHKKTVDIKYKYADALFPHAYHLTIYRCNDCHSGLFTGGPRRTAYTMADMEKKIGRSCGSCHDGIVAFYAYGSCGRCHKSTKELTWLVKGGGRVIFSHEFHMNKKYKCDDCHFAFITTGTMANRTITMKQMEKGDSCGACHDGKEAFTVSANCNRCHPVRDIDFTLDAKFSHTYHYALYSCTACHNKLFKDGTGNKSRTMVDMEQGLSCGGCHLTAKDAFSVTGNCGRCHLSAPELVIYTKGAGGTPFSHKIHIAKYKCDDCHNKVFTTGVAAKRYGMAGMEAGMSCGACHIENKDAFSVKANCTRCHPVKDINYRASGALFKHTVHTPLYRCDSCHDKLFVPGPGRRQYFMPEMEEGKSCGACHNGKEAFSVKGDCVKCHPYTKIVKYEFPDKKTSGVMFSHKYHIDKNYKCTDCHYKVFPTGINRRSYTMREMAAGKSCGKCHGYNITGSPNCARCHNADTPVEEAQ